MTNRVFHVIFFMPVVLTGILIYLFYIFLDYGNYDPHHLALKYENAPEHTAYLDVLIRLSPEDENYTSFKKTPEYYTHRTDTWGTKLHYQKLPLEENSQIAQYHENGYVSMSLHYGNTENLIIWNSVYNQDHLYENQLSELNLNYHNPDSISEIYQKYGRVKAAYVDESGNILQVTNLSGIRYNNGQHPAQLSADGKKLILELSEISPLVICLTYICQIGWLIYFLILLILLIKYINKEIRRKIRILKNRN